MLYPIGKQAYKLELPGNWKVHNILHVSLLGQDTIRKGRVFLVPEFESGNDKEYKVKAIRDSTVYARESKSAHLPDLNYLVSWKRYFEEKNTWEPALAVQHLRKLISLFHKDHPDKSAATFPATDTGPPMARPIAKSTKSLKRK